MIELAEGLALVQTVDFFSPIVDDPYLFGQIAAANSLSDIYAMGATPLTALNVACFPTCLTVQEMGQIMQGGADKLREAGVLLLGGHTVENPEPRFGMAVTGVIDPRQGIWTNGGAQVGDSLLLTKALGTGVLGTAVKAGFLNAADQQAMVESMCLLNRRAAELLRQHAQVHGCTDITGFGLLGHVWEMAQAANVEIELWAGALPILPGALDNARMGLVPAGAYRNREFVGDAVTFAADVPLELADLMFDPQTSGGLLVALPAAQAQQVAEVLQAAGLVAQVIGRVCEAIQPAIRVLA